MSGTVCEERKFRTANFSNVYQQAEPTCGLRHGDSQHACRSTKMVNSAQLPNRACINQTNTYMGAVPSAIYIYSGVSQIKRYPLHRNSRWTKIVIYIQYNLM